MFGVGSTCISQLGLGLHNTVPQAEGLTQQNLFSYSFERWMSKIKVSEASLLGM